MVTLRNLQVLFKKIMKVAVKRHNGRIHLVTDNSFGREYWSMGGILKLPIGVENYA